MMLNSILCCKLLLCLKLFKKVNKYLNNIIIFVLFSDEFTYIHDCPRLILRVLFNFTFKFKNLLLMVVFYVSITFAVFSSRKESQLANMFLEITSVKIPLYGLTGKWKFGSYLSDTSCHVIPY